MIRCQIFITNTGNKGGSYFLPETAKNNFLLFDEADDSKQLPHIHRKEIFRTNATITYNKCRLRIE